MAVTISGMFGEIAGQVHTYFADSPVVIDISGLEWSAPGGTVASPFTIVRVEVIHNGIVVGEFRADTGGQTSISFDISSALRAIWGTFGFGTEVGEADKAAASTDGAASFTPGTGGDYQDGVRKYREYSLRLYTEYLSSDDGGTFVSTYSGEFTGGRCAIGGFTEWERSTAPSKEAADVSYREHENLRNGDASTKPDGSPERVGRDSITSWVDVGNAGTKSVFYPAAYNDGQGQDDAPSAHAPMVLRDSMPYVDFLFVNRRGAIETCSALTLESMGIGAETQQYAHVKRPTFKPSRSLMATGSDGRRSWPMSSGYLPREWAEWWAMEFLLGKRKQWWMRYPIGKATGRFVPVIVRPSKDSAIIYDRTKQGMPHVDFTVTLALEG